ncbi:4-phosphoerythronate dehydrogenase PdxB [Halomonas binhaiensis]|uniref:Erythronate-4-phosphate dehydrogenase n=1 Tax=Halomonas binhaiensis TaxID=2562282 RepID=A0A5C1ND62_9GAMM|nr:4-phosphoerythronate dehydrogenase PdxB [Halomonas binhaiensis]QEM81144.1 4-phosphoerythronate dehydrogenase PdxB [Halomonas binhaiensis]
MKILVDANVPASDICFSPLGEVHRMPGREIDAQVLADIDALVIRSITRLDAAVIDQAKGLGSPLSFVGTCTIGTDHVDQSALKAHGVGFSSAPGCNAEAVVDYVLAALGLAMERSGEALADQCIGIVGVGNVGGRLAGRLAAMGIAHRLCDPPRAAVEAAGEFMSLERVIEECNVLCLHTPLVREGEHATHHLLNAQRIAALRPGTVLLNAGRGDCVDGDALKQRLQQQGDITALLDVWEGEPAIDVQLERRVDLATPHIAGHSLDGKLRGTHQIYQALSRHLGLPARISFGDLTPEPPLSRLELGAGLSPDEALRLCMRAVYDPRRDHDRLDRALDGDRSGKAFDACRANYPLRREFATLEVGLKGSAVELAPWLSGAGFRVCPPV